MIVCLVEGEKGKWHKGERALRARNQLRIPMARTIRFSASVDEAVWNELRELVDESHQNISGLLTEAISEYVRRRRVRPEVLRHLDQSIAENEKLGRLLAG